jgi:hypothetical protein
MSGKPTPWGLRHPQMDRDAQSSWMADAREPALEGKRLQGKERGGACRSFEGDGSVSDPVRRGSKPT